MGWSRRVRRAPYYLGLMLMLVGFASCVGQGCVSAGAFGQARETEWPVGETEDAIRLADGRYAVPLANVGRIQIYAPDLQYKFGWRAEGAGGASFALSVLDDGNLQAVTKGDYVSVFRPDGTLVSRRKYDRKTESFARPAPDPISLHLPRPLWQVPVWGSLYGWGLMTAGIVLANLSMTAKERHRERRPWRDRVRRVS